MTSPTLAALLRLAWPVIVARIGIMTMGLVDSIVVGRHSSSELAYMHLGLAPVSVVLTTVIGLLVGVQVMAARHVGEGAPARAGAVLWRGVRYALLLGLLTATVLHFSAEWLMQGARLSPDLAAGGARVTWVLAWSMVPYAVAVACSMWLEGLARPVPGMIAMLAANLINLAANLWLVPSLGAVGSAWATFGARVALMLMLIGVIALWSGSRRHGVYAPEADGADAARQQRQVGYGGGASNFVEVSAFAAMTLYAGWLGGLDVAAWGIVLNVAALIFMVPLGLSTATGVLVGNAYGARNRTGVVRAATTGFTVCAVVTLVIAIGVAVGAEAIARTYTHDAALIAAVVPALLLSALFYTTDGLQVVGAQALRARGDVAVPTITHIISYAILMLPLGYAFALPMDLGINGLVWSVNVASLAACAFLLGRFALLARRPLG